MRTTLLFCSLLALAAADSSIGSGTREIPTGRQSTPSVPIALPRTSFFLVDNVIESNDVNGPRQLKVFDINSDFSNTLFTGNITASAVSSEGRYIVAAVSGPSAILIFASTGRPFEFTLLHKTPLTSCLYDLCNIKNVTISSGHYIQHITVQSSEGVAFYKHNPIQGITLLWRQPLRDRVTVMPDSSIIAYVNQSRIVVNEIDWDNKRISMVRELSMRVDEGQEYVISQDGKSIVILRGAELHRYKGSWTTCFSGLVTSSASFSHDNKYAVLDNGYKFQRWSLQSDGCYSDTFDYSNSFSAKDTAWIDATAQTIITTGYRYYVVDIYNVSIGVGSVCFDDSGCPYGTACDSTTYKCQSRPSLLPVEELKSTQKVYIISKYGYLTSTPNGLHFDGAPPSPNWQVDRQSDGVTYTITYIGDMYHTTVNVQTSKVEMTTGPVDAWSTFSLQIAPDGFRWTIRTAADDTLWRAALEHFGSTSIYSDGQDGDVDTHFVMYTYSKVE